MKNTKASGKTNLPKKIRYLRFSVLNVWAVSPTTGNKLQLVGKWWVPHEYVLDRLLTALSNTHDVLFHAVSVSHLFFRICQRFSNIRRYSGCSSLTRGYALSLQCPTFTEMNKDFGTSRYMNCSTYAFQLWKAKYLMFSVDHVWFEFSNAPLRLSVWNVIFPAKNLRRPAFSFCRSISVFLTKL